MTKGTSRPRKMLALLLTLSLLAGWCAVLAQPVSAFGGDGSQATPYLIGSVEDLVQLQDDVNGGNTYEGKYFQMTGDIDLGEYLSPTGAGYNGGAGWQPIGITGKPFLGHFDGGGFAVKNLMIDRGDTDDIGLFGAIGGSVKNLSVADCNIKGGKYTGGVVGSDVYGAAAKIENCAVSGSVTGTSRVGGILGYGRDNTVLVNCRNTADVSGEVYVGGICGWGGDISHCSNSGKITAESSVGGIVATALRNISHCYNTGAVTAVKNTAGGIVAEQKGEVTLCFNAGDITAGFRVGGISGQNIDAFGISTCYNTGTITATDNDYGDAGGICGMVRDSGFAIEFCYSAAPIKVTARLGAAGGILGSTGGYPVVVQACYYDKTLYAGYNHSGVGTGLTTEEMLQLDFAEKISANFTRRPDDEQNAYYPELTAFYNSADTAVVAASKESVTVKKPAVGDIAAQVTADEGDKPGLTAPVVTSEVHPVTVQGWQLSADGTNWADFDPEKAVTFSQNGCKLRYFATSAAGTSYSNEMAMTVNRTVAIRANTGDCRVSGVEKQYKIGDTVSFTATGSGEIAAPIAGDQRYVPVSWKDGKNTGSWGKAPYTGAYKAGGAGNYTLAVTFSLQRFDGTAWADTGETALVTCGYTVTPTVVGTKTPVTGDTADFTAVLALLLSGALLLVALQKKRGAAQ